MWQFNTNMVEFDLYVEVVTFLPQQLEPLVDGIPFVSVVQFPPGRDEYTKLQNRKAKRDLTLFPRLDM